MGELERTFTREPHSLAKALVKPISLDWIQASLPPTVMTEEESLKVLIPLELRDWIKSYERFQLLLAPGQGWKPIINFSISKFLDTTVIGLTKKDMTKVFQTLYTPLKGLGWVVIYSINEIFLRYFSFITELQRTKPITPLHSLLAATNLQNRKMFLEAHPHNNLCLGSNGIPSRQIIF